MGRLHLYLPFEFVALHSLSGFEKPHPHLWRFEAEMTGPPIDGRIVDLYTLGQGVSALSKKFQDSYLNENAELSTETRAFPTCETLAENFYRIFDQTILPAHRAQNPELKFLSLTVHLCDPDTRHSMGSAKYLP